MTLTESIRPPIKPIDCCPCLARYEAFFTREEFLSFAVYIPEP